MYLPVNFGETLLLAIYLLLFWVLKGVKYDVDTFLVDIFSTIWWKLIEVVTVFVDVYIWYEDGVAYLVCVKDVYVSFSTLIGIVGVKLEGLWLIWYKNM